MRRSPLLLACIALLAGCTASAEDPWAYTRKPLYTGHFDLAEAPTEGDSQVFRVEDGSIALIRVQVWVNATQGGGTIRVTDPAGSVHQVTETTDTTFPLRLGVWRVQVMPEADASGTVDLLVTRA